MAFCVQQPWILSGSVRSNVTFGAPLDKARYNEAIRCCAMLPDLEIMTTGDQTEIGEKGINISGAVTSRYQHRCVCWGLPTKGRALPRQVGRKRGLPWRARSIETPISPLWTTSSRRSMCTSATS